MHHFDEAKQIWKLHVPPRGQADTVQGELLRAVERLRDEAMRNGNCNWDADQERLVAYLEGKLLDPALFAPDVVSSTRRILTRVRDFEDPLCDDESYDELCDRVVEYFRHHGSQSHAFDPELTR